ncbi:MAG: hypothetical protein H0X65_11000 [Gemmatimonadetes bacterium]|nr:hypothetical protein [Gemmatimonadota bacterium]
MGVIVGLAAPVVAFAMTSSLAPGVVVALCGVTTGCLAVQFSLVRMEASPSLR